MKLVELARCQNGDRGCEALVIRHLSLALGVMIMTCALVSQGACSPPRGSSPKVKLGIEVLMEEEFYRIRGRRVGLLTNHTGVDSSLRSTVDILHEHPEVKLVALFSAEHGIRGSQPDGQKIESHSDPITGVPVYSLYGSTRQPKREWLEGLDVMLVDIQDIGSYWYTYQFTVSYLIEACGRDGVPVLVLDRPNPLGGEVVEGPLMPARSIWRHPLPVRPGLTLGELALVFNEMYLDGAAEVDVVRMQGWERWMHWEDTGLPWVLASPNIPTPETALIYAGTCLFEGTNVSEGRGTTKPFHLLGAPWIDPQQLVMELRRRQIPGVLFRPTYFIPWMRKYAGEEVGGLEIHVSNRRSYRAVATALHVAQAIARLFPEFEITGPFGRIFVDHGLLEQDVSRLVELYQEQAEEWKQRTAAYRLY